MADQVIEIKDGHIIENYDNTQKSKPVSELEW